jgi:hypothetical protein
MKNAPPQSFENHRQVIPLFLAALGILILSVIWSAYRFVLMPGIDSFIALLVAVALVILSLYARRFALTVQNRVIRLEMRLRLRELLPADLQHRIEDLSPRQLIALRFAGDEELPELCRKVLTDNMHDQKAIKKLIRSWKPDHLRA